MKNIIIVLLILLSFNIFSQTKLKGEFCSSDKLKNFSVCLIFEDKNFVYNEYNDYGYKDYGRGDYSIVNKNLILNFNKSKLFKQSYHKSKFYKDFKDSVLIKFKIKDRLKDLPLKNVNIINVKKKNGVLTNNNGVGVLKLKKGKSPVDISINFLGYNNYELTLDKSYNYEVDVFLSNDKLIPIKDTTINYKIVEISEDLLTLNYNGRELLFKRKNNERMSN